MSTFDRVALERDDFAVLTEPVYVRGYYRKCAKVLSLPETELIGAYDRLLGPKTPPMPTKLLLGNSGSTMGSMNRRSGPNLLVVLAIAAVMSYLMLWTPFYEQLFHPWVSATSIDLAQHGIASQELGAVIAGLTGMPPSRAFNAAIGGLIAACLLVFVLRSAEFRGSADNLLGGTAVGLAVLAGWYLTGGSLGQAWKEYAEFATVVPSRVQVQSYTFISPMGDTVRYLLSPGDYSLINFGVVALAGVIAGSFVYAMATRGFRVEWFVSMKDFANHAIGGVLMGVGGVLSMGCTVGQAITGMSTVALGAFLTFMAIVAGAAGTMKYQYWRMLQED